MVAIPAIIAPARGKFNSALRIMAARPGAGKFWELDPGEEVHGEAVLDNERNLAYPLRGM